MVLNSTIDRYAHGSLQERDDGVITVHSLDLNIARHFKPAEDLQLDGELDLVKAAVRRLAGGQPERGFDLIAQHLGASRIGPRKFLQPHGVPTAPRSTASTNCPHEAGTCDCRKPGTGLLERAREDDPEIAFERAVMIGDSQTDVDAGRAAGIMTVAIGSASAASHCAADLSGAVDWVLSATAD